VRTRLYASLALAVLLAILVHASTTQPTIAATDEVVILSAVLTGAAEVPPADPDGIGAAGVAIFPRRNSLCFTLAVHNIAAATAAHIHAGAAGTNGGVVVPFTAPSRGFSFGCVPNVMPDLLRDIVANPGNYYVNVHNAEFPGGAIRGQLRRLGR
jgi:hypothetical protein